MSDSLKPHGLQCARFPCPSLCPGVCSDSCPLSRWCHLTISSSATLFSFCLQSFPASGSFPMSQLFTSGGQSIGVSASASVLPMNIQGWVPLGLTSLISFNEPESEAIEILQNETQILPCCTVIYYSRYSISGVRNTNYKAIVADQSSEESDRLKISILMVGN